MPESPFPPASLTGPVRPGFVLVGRYALVRLIARGGMADVWEAKDTLLERQVAVKILHPHLAADQGFVSRFRTEAVAAARLHHRSIVAIFDTCSDGGVEAIVMELARGHTLREEIDWHGALDPLVVINVGVDVADALQSAHAAGLIHRDVKPGNILLCDDQRVMVTDFGIAKVRDNADHTQTGTMLGSVKYVSPEQVEGKPVDPRSDVYSLGVVLYEALTGQAPFVADTPAATALSRLHNVPPHPNELMPSVPRPLADVAMRAMSRRPEHRYASATEMRAALLASRSAPQSSVDATQVAPRPQDTPPSRPVAPPSAPSHALAGYGGPGIPGANADPGDRSSKPPTHRGSLLVAVALVLVALIVVVMLLNDRDDNGQGPGGTAADRGQSAGAVSVADAKPLELTAHRSFDPFTSDAKKVESENLVKNVTDGQPNPPWHTEYYPARQMSANGKAGIGIIVAAEQDTKFTQLLVASPSMDWAAEVYVSPTDGQDLSSWGQPVDRRENIAGDASFDLQGAPGRYVLLWITRLAASPLGAEARGNAVFTVLVNEINASGSISS